MPKTETDGFEGNDIEKFTGQVLFIMASFVL